MSKFLVWIKETPSKFFNSFAFLGYLKLASNLVEEVGDKFWELLTVEGTRLLEMTLYSIALVWGAFMCRDDWFSQANTLHVGMKSLMPQWIWNTALIVLGARGVWAALTNDVKARRFASLCFIFFWTYLLVSFYRATIKMPGCWTLYIYISASSLSYWKCGLLLRHREGIVNADPGIPNTSSLRSSGTHIS